MTKWNYQIGSYERFIDVLSDFVSKLVLLTVGGVAGILGGLSAAVAITQAGVQPVIVEGDSSLEVRSTLATPQNLQPAANVQWVQGGEDNTDWYLQ